MSGFITKDSGTREEYPTGMKRDTSTGKGLFDELSPYALYRLAMVMERGAVKYNKGNWRAGCPQSRLMQSAFRHLMQYLSGEKTEDHLAGVMFNVMVLIHQEELMKQGHLPKELNDMPFNGDGLVMNQK